MLKNIYYDVTLILSNQATFQTAICAVWGVVVLVSRSSRFPNRYYGARIVRLRFLRLLCLYCIPRPAVCGPDLGQPQIRLQGFAVRRYEFIERASALSAACRIPTGFFPLFVPHVEHPDGEDVLYAVRKKKNGFIENIRTPLHV